MKNLKRQKRGGTALSKINSATKIPDWQAEDYETSAPFDWLYQYKDQPFVFAQLRNKIKNEASAVGVKGFITLWNSYLESRNLENGITISNVTQFDGQPIELECGEYICTDTGVATLDRYSFEIMVCPHPILPIKRLVNIDTGEVKIEIAFRRTNQWRRMIFDKSVLSSGQKIVELSKFGVAVDSESARDLVKYLSKVESLNYDKIEETRSVGRLGWIGEEGFSPYVDGIVFDGDLCYKHIFDSIRHQGSFDKWKDLVLEIRKGSVAARIVLAASFASVLVAPLDISSFFVHLWGGAGSGKTVGLMLAASVWADPALGAYISTMNSTSVGQEMQAGFVNSMPLIMDELQVVKDQRGFDNTIYMLAEGAGRNRGAKSGGLQRIQTWKNCILTTGEQPIVTGNSGTGAALRVVEIDCKDEKLFSDPRRAVSILKKNYGFAGKVFVDHLMEEGIIDAVREMYETEFAALQNSDVDDKQSLAGAIIITADKLVSSLIFADNCALTREDIESFLVTKDRSDSNKRAYEWILDFVSSNPSRFMPDDCGRYSGECWGKVEGEVIYFNKSVFETKMHDAGFNCTSFLSWAKRNGKILCDSQGKNTKPVRIRSVPRLVRCVCIVAPDDHTDD